VVVVRPERVRVEGATAAPVEASENSVTGTLTDAGQRKAMHCDRLRSGHEVIVMQQGGSRLTIERGQTVRLSWEVEDALALPC
jgi:hypothetical protein